MIYIFFSDQYLNYFRVNGLNGFRGEHYVKERSHVLAEKYCLVCLLFFFFSPKLLPART